MTAGLSAARSAAILNTYRGVTLTAPAGVYVKLHTGDPGAAGTANASAVTTRNQLTLAAPSGGAASLSALASYSMTGVETITHVSIWDAATGGAFQESWPLQAGVPVVNGSTFTVNTFTLSYNPNAA